MRVFGVLAAVITVLALASVADVAEGADERAREARKEARRVEQGVEESENIRGAFKDEARLTPETERVANRIDDRRLTDERVAANLAKEMRRLFKLAGEKLGKERDLAAQTEAAERKARAEEEARMAEYSVREKRKVDITIIFDW